MVDGIPFTGPILALIVLIVLWIVASLPVYFASKVVTGGRSTLGRAMIATLAGTIVFVFFLAIYVVFLGTFGAASFVLTPVLAFIVFLAVYRSIFKTGWLGAFGIAILAIIIQVVLTLLLAAMMPPLIRFL